MILLIKSDKIPQNSDQENALIQVRPNDQHGTEPNDQGAKKVSRRTITIDDDNERNLNQLRGWLLTKKNMDLDYTSAINMALALGFNRITKGNLEPNEIKITNHYIHGSDLKIASLDDEHWNLWIENAYPEMIKKLEKLEKKKTPRNSVKRKKKDDVPEA